MNLELAALNWLRSEKNCILLVQERAPRPYFGEPDVLGVTSARYMLEIEIKRSKSDFYRDKQKRHRRNRDLYLKWQPKFMWYMVPEEIGSITPPDWAGLLTASDNPWIVNEVKSAPVNSQSLKLSLKECAKLARNMVNYTMSLETRLDASNSLREGLEPYYWSWVI